MGRVAVVAAAGVGWVSELTARFVTVKEKEKNYEIPDALIVQDRSFLVHNLNKMVCDGLISYTVIDPSGQLMHIHRHSLNCGHLPFARHRTFLCFFPTLASLR